MSNANCTCGARLPEDARFCHKCGKPQYEDAVEEAAEATLVVAPAPADAPPIVPPAPPPISLRNPAAVRVGMLVSLVVALLLAMPMPHFFGAIWQIVVLLASGFFSVYLYHRRTGVYLSVQSGARMGWITGIFCFLVMLVMFTVGIAVVAGGEGMGQLFNEALASRGTPEVAEQLKEVLQSPAGVAALVFGMVAASFLMAALLAMAGGALGAKILEKE